MIGLIWKSEKQVRVLACSAIGMSKKSKFGTGGDFPESLAGGSGMATVSGDDFDRHVKPLVEEILRGQTT